MPQVYYSTIISAPLEKVWEMVRDFSSLPKWHPHVLATEIEDSCGPGCTACIGCVRRIQLEKGEWMKEKLLALSDADFTLTYSIVETKMKVANFMGAITLTPVTSSDDTFAEWEAVFDVAEGGSEEETADAVLAHFSAGLENLDEIFLGEYDVELSCRCNTEDKCTCGEDEDGGEKPRAEG
ncbi:SRPBCC family protein [Aminivibrio sp.]